MGDTGGQPRRRRFLDRSDRRILAFALAFGLAVVGGFVVFAQVRDGSDGRSEDVSQVAGTDETAAASPSGGVPPTPTPTPSGKGKMGAKPTPSASKTPESAAKKPPTSRGGYPDAGNTGVPSGVSLKSYTGPCTITKAGTVIDSRSVKCSLVIKARNVVVKKSRVDGTISSDSGSVSVRIEDSEVDGGSSFSPTVGYQNVTILRSEIQGGQHGVTCTDNCLIQDSWIHGQHLPPGEDWHLNAFLSNGGNNIKLIHNTLSCDNPGNSNGGGCTADAAIFGDFSGNSYYTFDRNLFVANEGTPYCAYGGNDPGKAYGNDVHHIVFTNNVFQRGRNKKCGAYGPVTSFAKNKPGNVWKNNVWDDGTPVEP